MSPLKLGELESLLRGLQSNPRKTVGLIVASILLGAFILIASPILSLTGESIFHYFFPQEQAGPPSNPPTQGGSDQGVTGDIEGDPEAEEDPGPTDSPPPPGERDREPPEPPPEKPDTAVFYGSVSIDGSANPVEHASVVMAGGGSTTTDSEGSFELRVSRDLFVNGRSQKIRVSAPGFQSQTKAVRLIDARRKTSLEFALKPMGRQ